LATAFAVSAAVALVLTLSLDQVMTISPAQDQAYSYIVSHVPKGATIGFATTPWFYSPPLSPLFTAPAADPQRNRAARAVADYNLRVPPPYTAWDPSVLNPPPDWFILSDIGDTQDAIRLHWTPARPFLATLRDHYRPIVFENR